MDTLTKQTCKAARALVELTAAQLAEAAQVPVDTVRSFESGRTKTLNRDNENAIKKALEARGIQFLDVGQLADGPGVALRGASDE